MTLQGGLMSAEATPDSGEEDSTPIALRVGYVLTVVWGLVVLGYALSRGSSIFDLVPNEWGDFFAGATAPLAFLWLAVAVFLQKHELELQRQELREARRAQELQAKETGALVERNTEAVGVARQSFAEDKRRAQEVQIGQLIDLLAKRILLYGSSIKIRLGENSFRLLDTEGCRDNDEIFPSVIRSLIAVVPRLREARLEADKVYAHQSIAAFSRIAGLIVGESECGDFPVLKARVEMLELKRFGMLAKQVEEWLKDDMHV